MFFKKKIQIVINYVFNIESIMLVVITFPGINYFLINIFLLIILLNYYTLKLINKTKIYFFKLNKFLFYLFNKIKIYLRYSLILLKYLDKFLFYLLYEYIIFYFIKIFKYFIKILVKYFKNILPNILLNNKFLSIILIIIILKNILGMYFLFNIIWLNFLDISAHNMIHEIFHFYYGFYKLLLIFCQLFFNFFSILLKIHFSFKFIDILCLNICCFLNYSILFDKIFLFLILTMFYIYFFFKKWCILNKSTIDYYTGYTLEVINFAHLYALYFLYKIYKTTWGKILALFAIDFFNYIIAPTFFFLVNKMWIRILKLESQQNLKKKVKIKPKEQKKAPSLNIYYPIKTAITSISLRITGVFASFLFLCILILKINIFDSFFSLIFSILFILFLFFLTLIHMINTLIHLDFFKKSKKNIITIFIHFKLFSVILYSIIKKYFFYILLVILY